MTAFRKRQITFEKSNNWRVQVPPIIHVFFTYEKRGGAVTLLPRVLTTDSKTFATSADLHFYRQLFGLQRERRKFVNGTKLLTGEEDPGPLLNIFLYNFLKLVNLFTVTAENFYIG